MSTSTSAGARRWHRGESGSGKSTVARCIARLIDPTRAKVFLGDTEIATMSAGKLRPHRRRVQIVFQDPYRSMNPRIHDRRIDHRGADEFRPQARRSSRAGQEADGDGCGSIPIRSTAIRISSRAASASASASPRARHGARAADRPTRRCRRSERSRWQKQVLELLDEIRQRLNLAVLFIHPRPARPPPRSATTSP